MMEEQGELNLAKKVTFRGVDLKEERLKRELKGTELARLAGYDASTVCNHEVVGEGYLSPKVTERYHSAFKHFDAVGRRALGRKSKTKGKPRRRVRRATQVAVSATASTPTPKVTQPQEAVQSETDRVLEYLRPVLGMIEELTKQSFYTLPLFKVSVDKSVSGRPQIAISVSN